MHALKGRIYVTITVLNNIIHFIPETGPEKNDFKGYNILIFNVIIIPERFGAQPALYSK